MPSKKKRQDAVAAVASSSSSDQSDYEEQEVSEGISNSSEDCESNSDDPFVLQVAKKRVTRKVRQTYSRNIRRIKEFANRNGFETSVENGKLKCPLSLQLVEAYFEHLSSVQVRWAKHIVPGTMKNLAPGTITRVQAMVNDFYRQQFETVQPEISAFFHNFNRWYLLKISELMSLDPPQFPIDAISMPLGREAWKLLLLRIWQSRPRAGCTWASISQMPMFLNLAKTLLGRSERVLRMRWAYLQWKKDALGGKIPTSKSDQGGRLSYLKLMYPSLDEPESCVLLCIALNVCSKSRFEEGQSFTSMFTAGFRSNADQYFRSFVANLDETDKIAMQVGSCHSLPITLHTPKRTGAVILHSYSEAIHWNSCRQRGDHKVDTEDSYLKFPSEQQDGIMGRVLAGLEFGSHDFNAQAPHFSPEFAASIPYDKLIPGYAKFPMELREIFPYLIAIIIWHYDWLRKTLPSDSPVWSSVPLFTTQQVWLEKLSEKDAVGNFIHIAGGKFGAKSFLPLSGKSFFSDDHATLKSLNKRFEEFLGSWQNSRGEQPLNYRMQVPQCDQATSAIPAALSRKICEIHDMMTGNSVPTGSRHMQPCPQLPIADLPSTFTIPTGLRPEQLFRKWFCRVGHVPAWINVTKKQLPQKGPEGRRQRDLFNKYEKVMHYLIGPAAVDSILMDVEGSFETCWARFCTTVAWPVTTQWSCSTVYDKLTPELRLKLETAPPMQWTDVQVGAHAFGVSTVPALLGGLRAGLASADNPVRTGLSSAIADAESSLMHTNAIIANSIIGTPLPSAFRIPSGLTVERLWVCWYTVTTVSSLTGRWRDCQLLQRLKDLHALNPNAFTKTDCRSQCQYLSKCVQVLNALRACVPDLTDAEVEADATAALLSCIAAASPKYGDVFGRNSSVRTTYFKMCSQRESATPASE
jgi:hypothetical protein